MKRKNPDTGLHFKRGDKRPSTDPQDGKVFYKYKKPRHYLKYGDFEFEKWVPNRTDEESKRINPKTGKKYSKGDEFDDGKLFAHYHTELDNDGYRKLVRQSPESFKNAKATRDRRTKKKVEGKYRINPKTGKRYITGDLVKRVDGVDKYFNAWQKYRVDEDGYYPMSLYSSKEVYLRNMFKTSFCKARDRAKEKGLPFNLTPEYLVSIYPETNRCPVFGFQFTWNGDRMTSPSLDRIKPEDGYVIGNVEYISDKANMMKQNASIEELIQFSEYYIQHDTKRKYQPYRRGNKQKAKGTGSNSKGLYIKPREKLGSS